MPNARGAVRHYIDHLISISSICLLGVIIYSNTLEVPFVFDDVDNIQNNPHVHVTSLDARSLYDAGFKSLLPRRALANVTFALNYYFGRDDVTGYHIVNIIVHLINGVLVYLLALQLFKRAGAVSDRFRRTFDDRTALFSSLVAALIFTVHPLQTQAVTYIVQRMTGLAVTFYLLSLLLYVYGRLSRIRWRRWTLWAVGLLSWILGLQTKEITATLPLVVLLLEWYFFQDLSVRWLRRSLKYLVPLVIVLAIVAFSFLGHDPLGKILGGYERRDFTAGQRVLTQFRVVILYFSLLLYPHPARLNLIHHIQTSHSLLEPGTTVLCLALIVAMLGVAIYLARAHRLLSFCILWVFINLAMESSVIGLEMVFEHRMYLPMFGLATMAGFLAGKLYSRKRAWAATAGCLVVIALGAGTYLRNQVWRDGVVLWTDVFTKNPWEARALYNRAGFYTIRGQYALALRDSRKAIELRPDYAWGYNRLAWLLATCPVEKHRDGPLAVRHATRARELFPRKRRGQHIFLATLGAAYAENNNFQEALRWQRKAVGMAPPDVRPQLEARLKLYEQKKPYREAAGG